MKNENILCLSLPSWNSNYMTSTKQIMTKLSIDNSVIYVDYHYTIKDVILALFRKKKIPLLRIFGFKNRLTRIYVNDTYLQILSLPPALPMNWLSNSTLYKLLLNLNSYLSIRSINKVLKKIKFKHPIVINAVNPFLQHFPKKSFNEKLFLYYCFDDINFFC